MYMEFSSIATTDNPAMLFGATGGPLLRLWGTDGKLSFTQEDIDTKRTERILSDRNAKPLQHLLTLANTDPEIVKRVIIMRTKLQAGIKLTEREAEELLAVLNWNNFATTGLDLSGMRLPPVDLSEGLVGRNLTMDYAVVSGDCRQDNLTVDGILSQIGMQVHGLLEQTEMRANGPLFQNNMQVKGHILQHALRADYQVDQTGLQGGRDLLQTSANIGGSLNQNGLRVNGNLLQQNLHVNGNVTQMLNVGRDLEQNRMQVKGELFQGSHMKVGGDLEQEEMEVFRLIQSGLTVGGDLYQGIKVNSDLSQFNITVGRDWIRKKSMQVKGRCVRRNLHAKRHYCHEVSQDDGNNESLLIKRRLWFELLLERLRESIRRRSPRRT